MTDPAYFRVDDVEAAAADHIISQLADDPDSVMALPIPHGITAHERADLLDHHHAVAQEIRRRRHDLTTHVRHTPQGEIIAFDLAAP